MTASDLLANVLAVLAAALVLWLHWCWYRSMFRKP